MDDDISTKYRPITAEEQKALRDLVAQHGRKWRAKLRAIWMGGGDPAGTLMRLRDSHGPEWLEAYRMDGDKRLRRQV